MIAEGESRLPHVNWESLDAWKCEDSIKVDRLYACSLLQWSKQPLDTLEKWRALLGPNGKFLGCLFVAGSLEELSGEENRLGGFEWRSERQWRSYFEEAKFIVLQDTRLDKDPMIRRCKRSGSVRFGATFIGIESWAFKAAFETSGNGKRAI